jgi:methoxymalonate biosynthesis acyl carrier protein
MNDRQQIEEFVSAHINGMPLDEDTDIFGKGYVSSMFSVQIVAWLENSLGVTVATEDMALGNFRTVRSISEFVRRKRSESQVTAR